jgi:predicted RNA-binding protein YlxR (DUF448 family)
VKRLQKKLKNPQSISNNETSNINLQEKNSNFSPVRTCVICKNKLPKNQINRIVLINNEIIIDVNHKLNTYGYYLCNDKKCQIAIYKWLSKKKLKRYQIES